MLEDRLKQLRYAALLSQREVAEKLNISRACYSQYERGCREPDLDMLCRLADLYHVSTDYLLGRAEKTSEF